jgi:hypothetical protein
LVKSLLAISKLYFTNAFAESAIAKIYSGFKGGSSGRSPHGP